MLIMDIKWLVFYRFFFFLYYIGIILNSSLYACSAKSILKISILSSIIKLLTIYLLCSNQNINSLGLVISFITSLTVSFSLSLYGCIKYLKLKINFKMIIGFIIVFFISFVFIKFMIPYTNYLMIIVISFLLYTSLSLFFLRRFFN